MMDVDHTQNYPEEDPDRLAASYSQNGALLQIPDDVPAAGSATGAARNNGTRPVSAAVYPSPVSPPVPSASSSSRRHRASHTITSSSSQVPATPSYHDVYSHPAAVAYATAHPRRQIPKFGPYLLLQTLGEGEFGKVKLGLHGDWGEEVAVKLIRRGSVDNTVRMSKVEREIEVLRTLNHPNIVRLFDVIETDKYIGIILEYASGGELFDHILAHRYLRERDACKLFAQLISGVWYIHQKKIVHRDLKLENLLLDRNRNVIITDFGFANRFEHKSDDLMQTSCGSPCYAAPELVISEGLYVGSAVDIWSCGVILYAMLAGYLPFDDDPSNPDGDNINLLYKYIINTPLTFPDYISEEARDLLSIMLVPDPTKRSDLRAIMAHRWLRPYASMFNHTVDQLEGMAREQQQQKTLTYQRQMKARHHAQQVAASGESRARTQSHRADMGGSSTSPRSSRRERDPVPEFLYETPGGPTGYQSPASPGRRVVTSAIIPTSSTAEPPMPDTLAPHDDPRTRKESNKSKSSKKGTKTPTQSPEKSRRVAQRHTIQVEYDDGESAAPFEIPIPPPVPKEPPVPILPLTASTSSHQEQPTVSSPPDVQVTPSKPSEEASIHATPTKSNTTSPMATPRSTTSEAPTTPSKTQPEPVTTPKASSTVNGTDLVNTPSRTPSEPISVPNTMPTPTRTLSSSEQSDTMGTVPPEKKTNVSISSASTSSSKSRHRKGLSLDKLGFGKLLGNGHPSSSTTNENTSPSATRPSVSRQGSDMVIVEKPAATSRSSSRKRSGTATASSPIAGPSAPLSAEDPASIKAQKKARRTTLSVIVNSFPGAKDRNRNSSRSSQIVGSRVEPPLPTAPTPVSRFPESNVPAERPPLRQDTRPAPSAGRLALGDAVGPTASTGKAKKVMDWFRNKSLSRGAGVPMLDDRIPTAEPSPIVFTRPEEEPTTPTPGAHQSNPGRAPTLIVTTSPSEGERKVSAKTSTPISTHSGGSDSNASAPVHIRANTDGGRHPQMTIKNLFTPFNSHPNSSATSPAGASSKPVLRAHHGAVDPTAVTTGNPVDVFAQVTKALLDMGVQVQHETEYKYRCIRPKRKKPSPGVGLGVSTSSTAPSSLTAFAMTGSAASNGVDKRGLPASASLSSGSMLKGLLMRRGSSQTPTPVHTSPVGSPLTESESTSPSLTSLNNTRDPSALLPNAVAEAIYGDRTVDQGDEVRFSVELTRIDRLDDTYSLDLRRLKGNLRSYKFLYDTLRERCVLPQ